MAIVVSRPVEAGVGAAVLVLRAHHSLKVFVVGIFETVANPLFDDRGSLLNTESGYLP